MPITKQLSGFGNHHQSESIPGALPIEQNSPQRCPLNLYAEQLNGSAFTRSRSLNLHAWLYRHHPSVTLYPYTPYIENKTLHFLTPQPPIPLRWSAITNNHERLKTSCKKHGTDESIPKTDFIDGLYHFSGNEVANCYIYHCTHSMTARYLVNRDGEMLFIPYQGMLQLHTEFGKLVIQPGMIAVIPRGVVFKIELA